MCIRDRYIVIYTCDESLRFVTNFVEFPAVEVNVIYVYRLTPIYILTQPFFTS